MTDDIKSLIFRHDIGPQTSGKNSGGVRENIGPQTSGNNAGGVCKERVVLGLLKPFFVWRCYGFDGLTIHCAGN